MRKLLAALILGATLLVSSCAVSPTLTRSEAELKITLDAFADACRVSRYTCYTNSYPRSGRAVPVPVLEIRDLSFWGRGVRGLYAGGPQVYIDDSLPFNGDLFYVVLVHEIVHYLQRFGPENDLFQTGCNREGEAFEAAGLIAVERGRKDLDRRTTWWHSYMRCSGAWPGHQERTFGQDGLKQTPQATPDSPIID